MAPDRLEVEIWKATLPFRHEIHTVVGRMSQSATLVVLLRDGEGHVGAGYTGLGGAVLDLGVAMAVRLINECRPRLSTLLGIERFEERFLAFSSGGLSKAVASAISLAVWDLIGRREGVACADLWGRQPGKDRLDCYVSAFFMEVATADLAANARRYREEGFRYAKMRPSRSLAEDLERLGEMASVYPEPGAIALDAFNSWDVRTVRTFLEAANTRFLWIEDPTPYPQIGQVTDLGVPIAAGETCESLTALLGLHRAGVGYLLPDLGRIGGPVRFLEAARTLAAQGASVGGHVYPHYSAHLLACIPNALPVEWVEWQDPPFEDPPRPDQDGKLAVAGPGFGVTIDRALLERHGECAAVI